MYTQKTGNKKLFLIKQMLSLKYHDGSPMTNHLNNFQGIMNQLSAMGIKFDEFKVDVEFASTWFSTRFLGNI